MKAGACAEVLKGVDENCGDNKESHFKVGSSTELRVIKRSKQIRSIPQRRNQN